MERAARWVFLPWLLVATWLAISAFAGEWTMHVVGWFGMVYVPLLLVTIVVVRVRSERDDAIPIFVCAQTPMSLVPFWADLPEGEGALRLFIDVARQGDWRVIAGGVCILVASSVPTLFAYRLARGANRVRLGVLLGVFLLTYLPIVYLFEARMLFGGAMTCCGLMWFSTGALLRMLALITMLTMVIRRGRLTDR